MCLNPDEPYKYFHEMTFRGWLLPPHGIRNERKFYFDAGASDWKDGASGPSLKYFYNMWKRHDIVWDQINAYELITTRREFYDIIPQEYANFVNCKQCYVSSSPEAYSLTTPFLRLEIRCEQLRLIEVGYRFTASRTGYFRLYSRQQFVRRYQY